MALDKTKLYATNGKFLSKAIFWEMGNLTSRVQYPPLYTLAQYTRHDEVQGIDLPSAYEIYMNSVDEYAAAVQLVGNLKNWNMLVNSAWFMDGDLIHKHEGLATWREHKRAKDASAMKALLVQKAEGGDTTAMKAALAETKSKAPVGRKNKKTKPDSSSVSRISEFKKKLGNK